MRKRLFESVAGGLLLAAALAVLPFRTLRDAFGSAAKKRLRRNPHRTPRHPAEAGAIGEFCFERAIPAYEELIDEVAGTVAGKERG